MVIISIHSLFIEKGCGRAELSTKTHVRHSLSTSTPSLYVGSLTKRTSLIRRRNYGFTYPPHFMSKGEQPRRLRPSRIALRRAADDLPATPKSRIHSLAVESFVVRAQQIAQQRSKDPKGDMVAPASQRHFMPYAFIAPSPTRNMTTPSPLQGARVRSATRSPPSNPMQAMQVRAARHHPREESTHADVHAVASLCESTRRPSRQVASATSALEGELVTDRITGPIPLRSVARNAQAATASDATKSTTRVNVLSRDRLRAPSPRSNPPTPLEHYRSPQRHRSATATDASTMPSPLLGVTGLSPVVWQQLTDDGTNSSMESAANGLPLGDGAALAAGPTLPMAAPIGTVAGAVATREGGEPAPPSPPKTFRTPMNGRSLSPPSPVSLPSNTPSKLLSHTPHGELLQYVAELERERVSLLQRLAVVEHTCCEESAKRSALQREVDLKEFELQHSYRGSTPAMHMRSPMMTTAGSSPPYNGDDGLGVVGDAHGTTVSSTPPPPSALAATRHYHVIGSSTEHGVFQSPPEDEVSHPTRDAASSARRRDRTTPIRKLRHASVQTSGLISAAVQTESENPQQAWRGPTVRSAHAQAGDGNLELGTSRADRGSSQPHVAGPKYAAKSKLLISPMPTQSEQVLREVQRLQEDVRRIGSHMMMDNSMNQSMLQNNPLPFRSASYQPNGSVVSLASRGTSRSPSFATGVGPSSGPFAGHSDGVISSFPPPFEGAARHVSGSSYPAYAPWELSPRSHDVSTHLSTAPPLLLSHPIDSVSPWYPSVDATWQPATRGTPFGGHHQQQHHQNARRRILVSPQSGDTILAAASQRPLMQVGRHHDGGLTHGDILQSHHGSPPPRSPPHIVPSAPSMVPSLQLSAPPAWRTDPVRSRDSVDPAPSATTTQAVSPPSSLDGEESLREFSDSPRAPRPSTYAAGQHHRVVVGTVSFSPGSDDDAYRGTSQNYRRSPHQPPPAVQPSTSPRHEDHVGPMLTPSHRFGIVMPASIVAR